MIQAKDVYTFIGVVYTVSLIYRLVTFFWIYFLRTSSIQKYITGHAPYALVTGSTHGSGKAIAKELYRRGFNVIINSRTEEKTKRVAGEIKALGGGRDVRYFTADASNPDIDFKKLVEPFQDLNITVLVNHVGGSSVTLQRIDERPINDLLETVRLNALFPLQLIHTLLPKFRQASKPILILNIGSGSANVPPPRLSVYAASKAFLKHLTWGLSVDERYFTRTEIDFMYVDVGEVQKETTTSSLLCPDPDTFAKSVIDRIGCGQQNISGYIMHAIGNFVVNAIGPSNAEWVIAQVMKEIAAKYLEGKQE